jgi:restriction system protein
MAQMCAEEPYLIGVLNANRDGPVRVRSEDFFHLVHVLLHKLGCARDPNKPRFGIGGHADGEAVEMTVAEYKMVIAETENFVRTAIPNEQGIVDPTDYARGLAAAHGNRMARLFLRCLLSIQEERCTNPFSAMRVREWKDTKDLKDLFDSEDLTATYGTFLDQRYLKYLNENFEMIDHMNWRKFEGLTAEWFTKAGYSVVMGPGRNDNGIDLRLYQGEDRNAPPLIIVQCKRTKKQVDKVVVKSLYADLLEEKADSGLIVTTSSLTRGALDVCQARVYPIERAERDTLRRWIQQMANP